MILKLFNISAMKWKDGNRNVKSSWGSFNTILDALFYWGLQLFSDWGFSGACSKDLTVFDVWPHNWKFKDAWLNAIFQPSRLSASWLSCNRALQNRGVADICRQAIVDWCYMNFDLFWWWTLWVVVKLIWRTTENNSIFFMHHIDRLDVNIHCFKHFLCVFKA